MPPINYLAVAVAAVSSFLLGGLWYSPLLFLKPWNRASGHPEDGAGAHPPRVFVVSLAFALVAALSFAVWLGPEPPLPVALHHALLAGVGLVGTSFGINYQFSGKPIRLWLIDGGYHAVQFLIFGLVLGLWH